MPAERQFTGWDAFEKVIATDVNYVILATPPGFRPTHLKAAIAAGKNVFTEKPVFVDATGYKTVLAAFGGREAEGARRRRRHAAPASRRVPRGDEARAGRRDRRRRRRPRATGTRAASGTSRARRTGATWSTSCATGSITPGSPAITSSSSTCTTWTSATGAMGGMPCAVSASAAGRRARSPSTGTSIDHFGLDFEYANGVHMMSMCRQQPGHARPRGRSARRHEGHARDAGRPPLRDQRAERVEVAGRVHEPVPAGAHGPHREHPRRQAAQRAEAGGRQHADGGLSGATAAYTGKVVTFDQLVATDQSLAPRS